MGQKRLPQSEPVTDRVLEEVSEREEVDPIELTPPLHSVIDADALESLVSPSIAGERREGICVEFSYCGYDIVVEDDRTVEILND